MKKLKKSIQFYMENRNKQAMIFNCKETNGAHHTQTHTNNVNAQYKVTIVDMLATEERKTTMT